MSTALVTGATAGLGLNFARQLAEARYDLVLVARSTDRLEAVAAELRDRYGVDVEVMTADLADRADTGRVADRVASTERPVDMLVNNAGFGPNVRFVKPEAREVEERALDVMVRAVMILSHAAVGAMVARGHGHIINVGSVAGFAPMGTYSAVKAWVTYFTEGLAADLRGTGVTATVVCPGFTHTEFHQRANFKKSGPGFAWLAAEDVVREALADASRGKVVSVPSRVYKVLATVMQAVPRPLLRRVTR